MLCHRFAPPAPVDRARRRRPSLRTGPGRAVRVALAAAALWPAVPAAARAQRPAPVGLRPAAHAVHPAEPAARPRPVTLQRHAAAGTLVGAGLGVGIGLLSYVNNERKCRGCSNVAIPVVSAVVGAGVGAGAGGLVYLARRPAAPPRS